MSFEAFERFCGLLWHKRRNGVSNGLDALYFVKALGVGEGDEVIVPAHIYRHLVSIEQNRRYSCRVDVEETTFNIDPDLLGQKISPRTKAIVQCTSMVSPRIWKLFVN